MLEPKDYFDLSDPLVNQICMSVDAVWELVTSISEIVSNLVKGDRVIEGEVQDGAVIADGPIYVGRGAVIEPGAYVMTPCYIGRGAVIRHGAYVRPNSAILSHAILGHASEIKSSLMLPYSQAPHFAYVGDSVLGSHVNLGAGTKLSNVPVTAGFVRGSKQAKPIFLQVGDKMLNTGTRKLGAILGDEVQTGCNSVLNPGTLVGPRSMIYPNAVLARGFYPEDSIIKLRQKLVVAERKY